MAHVIDGDRASEDRQQFLEHRRIHSAFLRCLGRDVTARVFRAKNVTEYLVAYAAADQAAKDSACAGSCTHYPAAPVPTEESAEHPAEAATLDRLGSARVRSREPLGLHAIGDMREERTGAPLHCRFINAELLCDRTRATSLIKQ